MRKPKFNFAKLIILVLPMVLPPSLLSFAGYTVSVEKSSTLRQQTPLEQGDLFRL